MEGILVAGSIDSINHPLARLFDWIKEIPRMLEVLNKGIGSRSTEASLAP